MLQIAHLVLALYLLVSDVSPLETREGTAPFGSVRPPSSSDGSGLQGAVIYGQRVTDRTQFGWMARLRCINAAGAASLCGGSLIKPSYVLTAAHCVVENNVVKPSVLVLLGGLTKDFDDEPLTEILRTSNGSDIKVHPNYTLQSSNDVAVLKLNSPVSDNQYIYRIQLYPAVGGYSVSDYSNQRVTIVGWGNTESGTSSTNLMYTTTLMRDTCTCDWYQNCPERNIRNFDPVVTMCYGGLSTEGICQGDSGGPVVLGTGRTAVQLAINSYVMANEQSVFCSARASRTSPCPTATTSTTTTTTRTTTTTTRRTTTTTRATTTRRGSPGGGTKASLLNVLLDFLQARSYGEEGVNNNRSPNQQPGHPFSTHSSRKARQTTLPCVISSPAGGAKVANFLPWINSVAI